MTARAIILCTTFVDSAQRTLLRRRLRFRAKSCVNARAADVALANFPKEKAPKETAYELIIDCLCKCRRLDAAETYAREAEEKYGQMTEAMLCSMILLVL